MHMFRAFSCHLHFALGIAWCGAVAIGCLSRTVSWQPGAVATASLAWSTRLEPRPATATGVPIQPL